MPLLTQPATLPETTEEPIEETAEAEAEVEEEAPKKGKKGKGGGGKKAKGGKGKKEEVDVEEEAGEITLIDEIWPKKEPLGLTKWYVSLSFTKLVVCAEF
jgi:PUA domain protein